MPDQRRPGRRVLAWLGGRRPPAPPRDHVPVTSATDGREHKVTDQRYTAAIEDGTGHCLAECGRLVVLASLATPPGPRCPECGAATGTDDGAPRYDYPTVRPRLFTDEGRRVLAVVVQDVRRAVGGHAIPGHLLRAESILLARTGDSGALVLAALDHLVEIGQLRVVTTTDPLPAHRRVFALTEQWSTP